MPSSAEGRSSRIIRLVTHDNQMSQLAPTPGVVLAKTLDSLLMPVMSMLVFIVPNFQALDVSNTVADGFAVTNGLLLSNILLAFAYALPFSIVGYFILKHREVAACMAVSNQEQEDHLRADHRHPLRRDVPVRG